MTKKEVIQEALENFAETVTAKSSQVTHGEPEDQLRGPFENFMAETASKLHQNVVCTGETKLPSRLGKPDFAVHRNKLLTGYVELKAPGVGADPKRYTGHNREQWNRFKAIPNLLYCDGNQWGLYRNGELVRKIVHVSGDVTTDGKKSIIAKDAHNIDHLLNDFLSWEPIIPTDRQGKIDLKGFSEMLAPLCRMLRDEVADALKDPKSPIIQLAKDWRQLLFPDASDHQFADAYAQTVTFALLLGRSEGADPLTTDTAESALSAQHSLLSRALRVLTDPAAQAEMSASLDLLLRVIGVVPIYALTGPSDPWLYFYEDFLAAYDPKLRKDAGAYYTPVEVVTAQVRLIDDLLVNRLGKPLGFADPGVVTLDPAAGTGTYLLGVIQHAMSKIEAEQGEGAVPGQATTLAANLYGFELMVGPYAVSELRVSRALRDRGATLPKSGAHIYLTDTLESPNAELQQLPLFLKPIAEQHARALKVKGEVPVIVCLGNPPYDRHDAVDTKDESKLCRYGGWVRFGDPLPGSSKKNKKGKLIKLKTPQSRLAEREKHSILRSFIDPAVAAGHGVRVHNLYNLYVYFWRWALWKVFEHETTQVPGVVSFISASSYLDGDAFCGMREHMRRLCDEIWVLDLGGEGRGTRKSENVFAIQTPVAIAVAVRASKAKKKKPARVHYVRIDGARDAKLSIIGDITDFSSLKWEDCSEGWQDPFRPAGKGQFFQWPLLTDLMPWQQSGVKAGRTWVISPQEDTLRSRWRALLSVEKENRKKLFKDSPTGRKAHEAGIELPPSKARLKPISDLTRKSQTPDIVRFAYRSFDRQFIFADGRLLDRPGPTLWRAHSGCQLYLTSLLTKSLGAGPSITACSQIPDLDHFSARGAKDIIPLYRDNQATEANILPGLLELLAKIYKRNMMPKDVVAYVYGALAQPAFTTRHTDQLESRDLRVPITKNTALFMKVRDVGTRLLWLHTYGERFVPKGKQRGHIPRGAAKCVKPVPGDRENYPESFEYNETTRTLHVGDGQFRPVLPEVYEFEVSGLKVVQSWLKYRMKKGAGKKSSPLDDIRPERWTSQFTTELLELLWVLEATEASYPAQAKLLEAVVEGPCFRAYELPPVPKEMRKPLKPPKTRPEEGGRFAL
jgi:hypothetical protein